MASRKSSKPNLPTFEEGRYMVEDYDDSLASKEARDNAGYMLQDGSREVYVYKLVNVFRLAPKETISTVPVTIVE